jgi:hypothetical protein
LGLGLGLEGDDSKNGQDQREREFVSDGLFHVLSEMRKVTRRVTRKVFRRFPIDWNQVQSNRLAGESRSAGMV